MAGRTYAENRPYLLPDTLGELASGRYFEEDLVRLAAERVASRPSSRP